MLDDPIDIKDKALCEDVMNYIKDRPNGASGHLIKQSCSLTKQELCLALAYLLGKGKIEEK